jgi:hypothetical protein
MAMESATLTMYHKAHSHTHIRKPPGNHAAIKQGNQYKPPTTRLPDKDYLPSFPFNAHSWSRDTRLTLALTELLCSLTTNSVLSGPFPFLFRPDCTRFALFGFCIKPPKFDNHRALLLGLDREAFVGRFSFLNGPTQPLPLRRRRFFFGRRRAVRAARCCFSAAAAAASCWLLAAGCWLLPSLPLGLRVGAPKAPPFAGRMESKQATR